MNINIKFTKEEIIEIFTTQLTQQYTANDIREKDYYNKIIEIIETKQLEENVDNLKFKALLEYYKDLNKLYYKYQEELFDSYGETWSIGQSLTKQAENIQDYILEKTLLAEMESAIWCEYHNHKSPSWNNEEQARAFISLILNNIMTEEDWNDNAEHFRKYLLA